MTEKLDLIVVALRCLSDRITLIELRAPDGGALPPFTAGAHLQVEVPGVGGRQYSLLNDPGEAHRYRIAVARRDDGRGGSVGLHRVLRLGAAFTVRPPVNLFPLAQRAGPVLLLGGGIGVTPLLAMAHELAREGRDFELHCAFAPDDAPGMADWLLRMPFADRVHLYGAGTSAGRLDIPALAAGADPATLVHVCGPGAMIAEAEAEFGARGIAVASEYFDAPEPEVAPSGGFEIEVSGREGTIFVAEGQTALDALRAAGIAVESSCEAGVCGTCRTRVLSGQLDHHDYILSTEERAGGNVFLPCVSRGCGRIVIDL
ncbi:PDR/VanB family oxidoreductase [Thalassovita mangrovi]|uniref:2Fe-2S iron-sulfur cluster binding domain-containing protein n=1 Tax=Thalassovita mangrovi TaxID=2692236 RepID=A0A6L8LR67_9RHOB|nr:PDR/VanB family oxidoreductase [Thalassovita mangrovi]MYM57070.1 2Fe-2S iron-sulfur cluster binding domain-containing protein [Thalassovita mangrovi]